MCSKQSACLRHWALLGPFKDSLYYVPLTNTQMHSPALLAKSELDGKDRKKAAGQEGEHPVGAVTCFVCFLMQTVSWIWALQICPLLSFTYRNSQSVFPGWRLMRGKECVPWEGTDSPPGATGDAPSCCRPEHDDCSVLIRLHLSDLPQSFCVLFIYLFMLGSRRPHAPESIGTNVASLGRGFALVG